MTEILFNIGLGMAPHQIGAKLLTELILTYFFIGTPTDEHEGNVKQHKKSFIQQNAIENVTYEIVAILLKPQSISSKHYQ